MESDDSKKKKSEIDAFEVKASFTRSDALPETEPTFPREFPAAPATEPRIGSCCSSEAPHDLAAGDLLPEVLPGDAPHHIHQAAPDEPAAPLFATGDCAFLPASISKPDGTKSRGAMFVRVLSGGNDVYRVSLGRGLITVCDGKHLAKLGEKGAPTQVADDLVGGFSVGDVVELADGNVA